MAILQKFFDAQAEAWDERISNDKKGRLNTVLREKINYIGQPLLDLGSGTGIMLELFNEFGLDEKKVFELDISLKMLTCAKNRHKPFYHCHFIQGDVYNMPFAGPFFKTIFCFQVFPHFKDTVRAARNILHILKNDGRLIILHLMGHHELNELHRRTGREVKNDIIPPAHQLAELLEHAGFQTECVEENEELYLVTAKKGPSGI